MFHLTLLIFFSCLLQTDDILPFQNSLVGEYALLMAPAPYGFGLTESEISRIAQMGFEVKF
jgi:adenosine deaminase